MKHGLSILFMLLLAGCSVRKVDTVAEGARLMQVSRDWSAAAANRDLEKTLNYWADDAILFSAGQPVLQGKAAIRQMLEASFREPSFRISWEPQSVQVSESGDMAYLIENMQMGYTDPAGKMITMQNKAVTIWRKNDKGEWKNVVDISTPLKSPVQ